MADLLSIIVLIRLGIWANGVPAGNQGNFGLLSFALLATLLRKLFFLHLLIAQSRQSASNLLDLVAGKVLGKLLCKFLQEDYIVCLLRVVA